MRMVDGKRQELTPQVCQPSPLPRSSVGNLISGFLMAIVSTTALANDGIGQLGIGGIINYGKSESVSMRKEILEISASRVKVDYDFFNDSDQDITLPVVFPLPPYTAILPSMSWAGQPVGFKLFVNGVEKAFVAHLRATIAWPRATGTDVTNKLFAIGLAPEQVAMLPGVLPGENISPFTTETRKPIPPITKKQRQALREAGLLISGPTGETDFPAWRVHVSYAWDMTFPAQRAIHVSHSYKPFRSLGTAAAGMSDSFDELKNQYCADSRLLDSLRNGLDKLAESNKNWSFGTAGTKVDYILTTANTWKGPIKDFTLRLKKLSPRELVSLCFPGTFRKVDPLTLEVHLQDFVPSSELSVRFINPSLGYGEDAASAYSDGPSFEEPRLSRTQFLHDSP